MKIVRSCVALGAAGALLLGVPAHAAVPTYKPKKLTLTDQAGDGNALNGQGNADFGSVATPVQAAGTDILKVEYASTGTMVKKGKTYVPSCTGFTVKVTLADAPMSNTIFRLTGVGFANDGLWWIQYDGSATTIRYGTQDESDNLNDHQTDLITPVKISGSTMTFTVKQADIKGTGEKLSTFRIGQPGAHDRAALTFQGTGATVPQWDQVADNPGVYKPC